MDGVSGASSVHVKLVRDCTPSISSLWRFPLAISSPQHKDTDTEMKLRALSHSNFESSPLFGMDDQMFTNSMGLDCSRFTLG